MTLNDIYSKQKEIPDEGYVGPKRYYIEMSKYPLLTAEEERMLVEAAKAGDMEAQKFLFSCHLRYIVKVAERYQSTSSGELDDLIELGNIGLMKSLSNYDLSVGTRLLTFSNYYIRREIKRGICHNKRGSNTGIHMEEWIAKYLEAADQLKTKFGREPTNEEIRDYLKISSQRMDNIIKAYYQRSREISLDAPIGHEDKNTLSSLISLPESDDDSILGERVELNELLSDMKTAINNNLEYEALVAIIMYKKTYIEVAGEQRYISAVRRRVARALYKLRTNDNFISKYKNFTIDPDYFQDVINQYKRVYERSQYKVDTLLDNKKLTRKIPK